MAKTNNIWLNGIMGVVTGDALGCPVQFESRQEVAAHPVTGMRGHGTFNLPEGSWTDDSSLTLALLESIRRKKLIDPDDIMENFVKWLYDGEFTPYGFSYDIGNGTMLAVSHYKKHRRADKCGGDSERNNGNGSLMRIMPACLFCSEMLRRGEFSTKEAVTTIHTVSGLTHAHIRAKIACGLYFFMTHEILTGEGFLRSRLQAGLTKGFDFYEGFLADKENPDNCGRLREADTSDQLRTPNVFDRLRTPNNYGLLQELKHYDRLRDLDAFAALPVKKIKSTGYVVDALEAAVWSLVTTGAFDQALLKAVNLGDDTDTVGAIAGGLAGLYYGYDTIPEDWLKAIKRRDWIEEMCEVEKTYCQREADSGTE